MNNFELFLNYISTKKIKPLNVKIHPLQKNIKAHHLFKNEISNLMKNYNKVFSKSSKSSYSVFFGATSAVIEALERKVQTIHICENPILESYSKKLWKFIQVQKINSNVYKTIFRNIIV